MLSNTLKFLFVRKTGNSITFYIIPHLLKKKKALKIFLPQDILAKMANAMCFMGKSWHLFW